MAKERQKFFICKQCGNVIGLINNSGVPIECCGEKTTELIANTTDAAKEKHVPVVITEDNKITVKIGSIPHPMTQEHHISWVYIQTEKSGQRKNLDVKGEPVATFLLTPDDKMEIAFAYCNLHGLWKAEV